MVFRNKIKNLIFVLLLTTTILCACLTVACGKAEERIVLYPDYDAAIVTKEYDAKSIVSDSNGYEVILIECYYLDQQLQRVEIPIVAGTKFTPTVEREVFVTLKIKGGSAIAEATIPVEAPSSPEQEEFLRAWNDEGVGKSLTANSEYLINGAKSAIKVTYTGSLGSNISGPGIGSFNYNDKSNIPFTVTDWTNAVLVMDIFNPCSENLIIYYCIIKDKATWVSDVTGMYGQQRFAVLPAGQWTKAVLSLNMIGIDFNPFVKYKGTMNIGFRVGHETLPSVKPYEWSLYLANMDITDYSAERFPDLQTKRFDQVLAEMDGEASDKEIYKHLLEENTDFRYIGIKTAGEIVSYAEESLSKPNAETGDYVNKYTVKANPEEDGSSGKILYSTPLYYNQNGRYQLNAEQKEIDYEKAEITFDIYNPNDFALPIYLVNVLAGYINLSQYAATAKALSWTTVTFSLTHLPIDSAYTFAVSIGGVRVQYETLSYYIDNVIIREKEEVVVNGDADDMEALNRIYATGSSKWTGTTTKVEVVEYTNSQMAKPAGLSGNSLLKYTHTSTNGDTTSGYVVNSIPLRYSSGTYAFNAEQLELNFKKVMMSFYIYNAGNEDVFVYFGTVFNVYYTSTNKGNETAKAGQWTKIDVPLYTFNLDLNGSYEFYIAVGGKKIASDEFVYYIDGISFYETVIGDANDKEALSHLVSETPIAAQGNHGIVTTAEIMEYEGSNISKPNGVEGDTLIKYTVTAREGDTSHTAGQRVWSTPMRYNIAMPLTAEQLSIDFSKMAVQFSIYNPNNVDLPIYLKNNIASYAPTGAFSTQTAKANSWTTVTFVLNGVTYDVVDKPLQNASKYDFLFTIGGIQTPYTTLNYYIDNVIIYERFIPDANDEAAIVHMRSEGGAKYGSNATTVATAIAYQDSGISKPEGVTGDSLIKYTYTSTNVDSTGMLFTGVPLRYTSGAAQAFDETEKQLDFSKAVLSFYIYNANSFDFTVYAVKGGVWAYFTANYGTFTAKAGQWTKVEIDLSNYNIDVNGSYDVVVGFGGDRFKVSEITYYIDNVTIYEVAE